MSLLGDLFQALLYHPHPFRRTPFQGWIPAAACLLQAGRNDGVD